MNASPKLLRPFGFVILTLLFSWPAPARGQSQDVLERAKKEGQLVFYAGIPVPDAQSDFIGSRKEISIYKNYILSSDRFSAGIADPNRAACWKPYMGCHERNGI